MEKEKISGIFSMIKKEKEIMEKEEVLKKEVPESTQIVRAMHSEAIIETVKNNENLQEKFVKNAERTVENELLSIEQENKSRLQETTYNANEDACSNYGISNHVPVWQINMMKVGSYFWFVIYWIFASLTIVPLNVFMKGFKYFIKNNIIVFIFSFIAYILIAIGIPLLLTYIK